MELAVARRAHVGHVDVADPAAGRLVDLGPVGIDPLAIAQRPLVGQRLHHHGPGVPAPPVPDGQLDCHVRLVDEQLVRMDVASHGPAAHGQQRVAVGDVHARCLQR